MGAVEQLGREGGARVAALVRVDPHNEPQVVLLEVGRLERHLVRGRVRDRVGVRVRVRARARARVRVRVRVRG